jgi:hypothetical protein
LVVERVQLRVGARDRNRPAADLEPDDFAFGNRLAVGDLELMRLQETPPLVWLAR